MSRAPENLFMILAKRDVYAEPFLESFHGTPNTVNTTLGVNCVKGKGHVGSSSGCILIGPIRVGPSFIASAARALAPTQRALLPSPMTSVGHPCSSPSKKMYSPATSGSSIQTPAMVPPIFAQQQQQQLGATSTCVDPDHVELIHSVGTVLYRRVRDNETADTKLALPLFCEDTHTEPEPEDRWEVALPLMHLQLFSCPTLYTLRKLPPLPVEPRAYPVPSASTVALFVENIRHKARLTPQSLVIALIYIDRLEARSEGVLLHARSWRPVVFASLLLASKVHPRASPSTSEPRLCCHRLGRSPNTHPARTITPTPANRTHRCGTTSAIGTQTSRRSARCSTFATSTAWRGPTWTSSITTPSSQPRSTRSTTSLCVTPSGRQARVQMHPVHRTTRLAQPTRALRMLHA